VDEDFRVREGAGGGVEVGETPFDAACREVGEETGLRDARVGRRSVAVTRDVWWAGYHFEGVEEFFVARVSDTTSGERHLSDRERVSLVAESWALRDSNPRP